MRQFGAINVSNTLALLFWVLFTGVLPEAITAELCFGDIGQCRPNIARLRAPDTEFLLNLLLLEVTTRRTECSACIGSTERSRAWPTYWTVRISGSLEQ